MANRMPTCPEEVTCAWLTAVLREAGAVDGASVVGLRTELLGTQGAAGVVARLSVEYDSPVAGGPETLVAKFASPYEPIRRLMHGIGGYAREVEFYRALGGDPGIPVPGCYRAEIDHETGAFVLLLQDMSDSVVRDTPELPVEEVEVAIRHLAAFHARWWGCEALRTLSFLRFPGDEGDRAFMEQAGLALAAALPVAKERFGDALPPVLVRLAEQLAADFTVVLEARRQASMETLTIVHGDFHPGQLFFPSETGGRFAVFDWQTVSVGRGGDDLARLIVTALRPEVRRLHDERLIRIYHEVLVAQGVRGFSLEECRAGFRAGLATTAILNLIAAVNVEPKQLEEFMAQGAIPLTDALFGWVAVAIEDHEVAALEELLAAS